MSDFTITRVLSAVKGAVGWLVNSVGPSESEYTQRQYFQHVGFISKVPSDAELITMKNGDNIVSIASAETDGDVPVLSAVRDMAIHFGADNYVMITSDSIKIISSGTVTVEGDGTAGSVVLGSGVSKKLINEDIITAMLAHTHGGVAPGAAATSTPVYIPALSTAIHATSQTEGS